MKVGDKVKCLINCSGYERGDIGTIVGILDNEDIRVFVNGRKSTSCWHPNVSFRSTQLELVQEEALIPQNLVGRYVRCLKDNIYSTRETRVKPGDILQVEVDNGGGCLYFKNRPDDAFDKRRITEGEFELMPEGWTPEGVSNSKVKFSVGDWVTVVDNELSIICKTGEPIGSTFQIDSENCLGSEQCCYPKNKAGTYVSYLRKALPHEIPTEKLTSEMLLAEAKWRYPVGTKFKCLHNCSGGPVVSLDEIRGDSFNCIRWHGKDEGCGCLYDNGKWAEIVQPVSQGLGIRSQIIPETRVIWSESKRVGYYDFIEDTPSIPILRTSKKSTKITVVQEQKPVIIKSNKFKSKLVVIK